MRHDHDQRCHVIDLHRGSDYYHRCRLDDYDRGRTTTTAPSPSTSTVTPDLPTTELDVGDDTLEVWVADEPAERQQGLRAVAELPDGIDGMLFVFPEPKTPNFIMSGTPLPLEVWFFDPEGSLIGSHEMTPCPADPCPVYPAPGPVGWALETPAGERDFQRG